MPASGEKLPSTTRPCCASQLASSPAGDAHSLGIADELPEAVRGHDQDVTSLASSVHAGATLALLRLSLAARRLPPSLAVGGGDALRPSPPTGPTTGLLLLLRLMLLLPAPAVHR